MPTPKRILTIDGGGLRGVFSAASIERMEALAGKPAREYFDCFYGTSTGAILATGLAHGMPAAEFKQFYLDKGARVFEKLPFYQIIKKLLYWTYSKKELEKELQRVFGRKKLFAQTTCLFPPSMKGCWRAWESARRAISTARASPWRRQPVNKLTAFKIRGDDSCSS
jgi:predicted acylesterase/phospholipase RssA